MTRHSYVLRSLWPVMVMATGISVSHVYTPSRSYSFAITPAPVATADVTNRRERIFSMRPDVSYCSIREAYPSRVN
ncbi:hypothetical protein D3C72_2334780 [compost metagenome]